MVRDFQRPFVRPAGATEVLLVRHGAAVVRGPGDLVDGRSDPPLTADGRAQADVVASRLAAVPAVRGLFATPLRRTLETARPLARRLGTEAVVVADLGEIHLGDWEGRINARVRPDDDLARQVFRLERWDVIPGAETMEDFGARVRRGLDAVADAVGPDAVAVAVVHGGVIAEACHQVTGSTPFAFLYAENCSITRLVRMPRGRWTLLGFNDVSHLDAVAVVGRS